jgi:hypothetical protein
MTTAEAFDRLKIRCLLGDYPAARCLSLFAFRSPRVMLATV